MKKDNPILKFIVSSWCLINLLGGILAQRNKKVWVVIGVGSNGTVTKIRLSCINPIEVGKVTIFAV